MSFGTPSQLRRTQQPLDTPTPAPSSGHTSTLITSLKPARSRSSFSPELSKASFTSTTAPRAPLGHHRATNLAHGIIPELDTSQLDLDHLEIATDGTERERRTLEEEIRRGMGELERRGRSSSSDNSSASESDDRDSVGFGDLSDVEPRRRVGGRGGVYQRDEDDFRARMEDESVVDEESSDSLGDDFSLRIGMAGNNHQQQQQQRNDRGGGAFSEAERRQVQTQQDERDEDDLTYLTISRTASPGSPRRATVAPAPIAGVAPSPALSFVRGAGPTNKEHAALAGLGFGGPSGRENLRPVFGGVDVGNMAQRVPAPVPTTHAPRLAKFPTVSPIYRQNQNSSSSTPQYPLPPNNTRLSGVSFSSPGLRGFFKDRVEDDVDVTAEPSRMRAPDLTYLTEGLASPVKARTVHSAPPARATGGAENLVINANLEQLQSRLANLERDNALSNNRVRELENDLVSERQGKRSEPARASAQQQQQQSAVEQKLREEQARREALESEVDRLRAHASHHTRLLESHSATLAALRSAAPRASSSSTGLEGAVSALRTDLDGLGLEVDAVKNVVEGLLQEGESRRKWEKEEGERKESLRRGEMREREERRRRQEEREQQEEQEQEDPDRTPRAHAGKTYRREPAKSFIDDAEIERLKAELAREEEARRSPTPRPRRTKPHAQKQRTQAAPLHRPSTAPLPTRHHHPAPRSHASYDDSYSSSAASRRQDRRPADEHHNDHNGQEEDDLQNSFRRAEEIFRSVSHDSAPPAQTGRTNIAQQQAPASPGLCTVCRRRRREREAATGVHGSAPPKMERWEQERDMDGDDEEEEQQQQQGRSEKPRRATMAPMVDPKRALENVLNDLEADFELHKKIYIELSDRYRAMDSKLGGGKRRTLAIHLKESIDTLEVKADQVKRLHDFLHSDASAPRNAPVHPPRRMREGII